MRHRLAVLMLTMLLSACSGAGVLNALAPTRGVTITPDLAYAAGDRHGLDIYAPAQAGAPVVVFLYGGGWRAGDRSLYRFLGAALAARGFLVVVPDYRVYPEVRFPAFVEDAAAAVAWTKQNIHAYGGDPERVFLMGHSAGAHIAAMLTLDRRFLHSYGLEPDRDIAGMIGLAGPYDFLPLHDPVLETIFAPAGDLAATQPITYARAGAPPMLLLTGDTDTIVLPANSQRLADRITSLGGAAALRRYGTVGHMVILGAVAPVMSWIAPVLDDCVAFMNRRLG